jgi:hypothetical protein
MGATLGFGTLTYADATKKGKSKPNIILMVSEDNGLQLSCYGDKHISTPNLDALAESGVRFDNAYVTQAGCSPSRASIFTGLYPHNNGQIGLATHGLRMYSTSRHTLRVILIIVPLKILPKPPVSFSVRRMLRF